MLGSLHTEHKYMMVDLLMAEKVYVCYKIVCFGFADLKLGGGKFHYHGFILSNA